MSAMLVNKIAGAILLVALSLMAIGTIGNMLVHPRDSGPAKAVVTAAAKPETAPQAPAAPEVPIAALLADAQPAAGAKVFKKCQACHTVEKGGKDKIGPNLWNVVNSDIGKRAGFSYSKAFAAKGGTWTYDDLNAFLTKPRPSYPRPRWPLRG